MKRSVLILILIVLLFCFCSKEKSMDKQHKENEETNKYVKNSQTPLKGQHQLKLERSFSIDPKDLGSKEKDVIFNSFVIDNNRNIFLLDGRNVKIYKFNRKKNLEKNFLNKGEGPGEFDRYPKIQILNNNLYITKNRKICKFSLDGELLEEFKLKHFYRIKEMVDENRFIAIREEFGLGKSEDFNVYISFINLRNEKTLFNAMKSENIGRFFIPNGKRRISVIPNPGVISDFTFSLNRHTELIYFSRTDQYKIWVKDWANHLKMIISRKHKNTNFTEADYDAIVASFGTWPENLLKEVRNSLPRTSPAIRELRVLPSGFLLAFVIKGFRNVEYDIFDSEGKYLYQVNIDNLKSAVCFKFFNSFIGVIEEKEDRNIYTEYKINSLKEVFSKK